MRDARERMQNHSSDVRRGRQTAFLTGPMNLSRRECLVALALTALSGCKSAAPASVPDPSPTPAPPPSKGGGGEAPLTRFSPEDFGAAGDGTTNDTLAFIRMSAAVNLAGGGTVVLSPKTYLVGAHVADPTLAYAYGPTKIMEFDGCTQPLQILGNGARLKCQDGLRFGTFDSQTGLPTKHSLPYYGTGELASPYIAMISVMNCKAGVYIEKLELDGNLSGLSIGGPYGDTGWQIPCYGIRLINNGEKEQILGVHTHHHPVDGLLIDGSAGRAAWSAIEELTSDYNGRQGCSIIGGQNYSFTSCKFSHTGKAGLASAPGAGLDIEPESSPVRNLKFSGCEFINNSGAGLVADSGDSAAASFTDCRFVGTTSFAAWPNKPQFTFNSCQFVGSICNTFGSQDPALAAQFLNCSFLDDPKLSPTGEVYHDDYPIADLSDHSNVLFDGCTFKLTNGNVLPWSINAIYKDVIMSQASPKQAYPRGTYIGTSQIDGNVDLNGSRILGQLTLNGKRVPPTG